MYHDLKCLFWWDGMKRDVAEFVAQCPNCQEVKIEHQKPGLPRTPRKYDLIWVVVDRLTKSAHFLPVRITYSAEDYARIYIKEIVKLHGVPVSIITNRGAQFTANFWRSFQAGLGTQMAPYEALYGRKCRSPIGWFDVGETKLIGLNLIQQAVEKVKLIQERLLAAQSQQKAYADNRHRPLEFQVDDWIVRKVGKVAYELDLPTDLEAVHPVFHVSMLRKFIGDPSRVFPVQDIQVTEELSYEEQPVAILDRQVRRLHTKDVASVKVLWPNNNRE
ncbi:uncharacterized protein LOC129869770 [Solanum dulcamara]|uniref:uncharacterized protein LOC129869770 n=1 Tax=Solanum dulcamara TaxID=45834 RepID=UPI002485F091|nr:uncharacterized protein LOC129869770 [Solanum dulcamara]